MFIRSSECQPPAVPNVLFQALRLEGLLWTFHLRYKDTVNMQVYTPWVQEQGSVEIATTVSRMEAEGLFTLKNSEELWLEFERQYAALNAMIDCGCLSMSLVLGGQDLLALTRYALKLKQTLLPGLTLVDQSVVKEQLLPSQKEHFYYFLKYVFTVNAYQTE